MSSSAIIRAPCRVRPVSLPVDIRWLKATGGCQYRSLVSVRVPPASNTADYWRPLIALSSCCPHSCYLADSSIVYMQMEVGHRTTETLAPNGKQTIGVACEEKVRSIELINTHKGDTSRPVFSASWRFCDAVDRGEGSSFASDFYCKQPIGPCAPRYYWTGDTSGLSHPHTLHRFLLFFFTQHFTSRALNKAIVPLCKKNLAPSFSPHL